MLSSAIPPEQTVAVARFAEESAFSRLWITEDYFRKGAFATAGAVLASTHGLGIGLGVASPYLRSLPALAMEISTLELMFPGRFVPGVGLGAKQALSALERTPSKAIGSLRSRMDATRALLAGRAVTWSDEFDALHGVELDFFPPSPTPIWLAAEGPQMLRLAAQSADGLILSAFSSPHFIRWARNEISAKLVSRKAGFPIVSFVYLSVHSDQATAYRNARHFVAKSLSSAQGGFTLQKSGHWDEIEPLLGGPAETIFDALREDVVGSYVAYGTVESCRQMLERYRAAGVSEIALAPIPVGGKKLELAEIMPLLAQLSADMK